MNFRLVLATLVLYSLVANAKTPVVEDVADIKDLKKLLRTKTNVLILFVSSLRDADSTVKIFRETAKAVKGFGTFVLIDCSSNSDRKKLCKKLKANPQLEVLKHFKNGDFHKDYDRQLTTSSLVNFMRDPEGELPWEEDPTGSDVTHFNDPASLAKFLKKDVRPSLIMFYAPWCGYCKKLKPEYSAAAKELVPKYVLAAIDVDRPENTVLRKQYNITGFPTLLYFESGKLKSNYEGDNKKEDLVQFMRNPSAVPVAKPKEEDWSTETTSEVVHLTTTGFESALKEEKSVLVMFYAPWCGHCKKMKPEYEKAAEAMKIQKIGGILSALDATKEPSIAQKFGVKGYPSVKYFSYGEFKFDVNVREADKIVDFMKDPKEPPPPPPPETAWEEEETDVMHLNEDNFKTTLKKKKHALVMFYAPWCGHCKKMKPEFTQVASHFKDDPRIELVAVDCTKHSSLCSAYKVKGYPTIKYFSYLKNEVDYDGGRKANDIIEFLNDPSAEKPKKSSGAEDFFQGVDNILILNDENFESSLRSVKKSLVMFYAPWCGHCKTTKPDFAAAAAKMSISHPHLKFAAINCDTNSNISERFAIHGFPSIKLFENGNFVKDYSGERTTSKFISFLINGDNDQKDEL